MTMTPEMWKTMWDGIFIVVCVVGAVIVLVAMLRG